MVSYGSGIPWRSAGFLSQEEERDGRLVAETRASEEQAARLTAESRVAELEAELRRLRG